MHEQCEKKVDFFWRQQDMTSWKITGMTIVYCSIGQLISWYMF
jgi:hypothetical protein